MGEDDDIHGERGVCLPTTREVHSRNHQLHSQTEGSRGYRCEILGSRQESHRIDDPTIPYEWT